MTKSLTWLLDCMLDESGMRCSTDTHRDKLTVSRRIEREGLSFVTITLPAFCADFEVCLREGQVGSHLFKSFKKRGSLPAFLQGLTSQVFDPVSGSILANPSKEAILCVRQLCLAHKKVNLPCSEERTRAALRRYKQVEKELTEVPLLRGCLGCHSDIFRQFIQLSGILWSAPLTHLHHLLETGELIPKHGPGSTAERISGNQKYNIRSWHNRLQPYFPYDAYGLSSPDVVEQRELWSKVEFVEPEQEPPVRVVFVPKTLKTPRVIAIEPVCMQYTQQALLEPLVRAIETSRYASGHVNFTDQSINRSYAVEASICGDFATMDLSDASDRVHNRIVRVMLNSVSTLVCEAVSACRSRTALLPDGTTIHLEKFASMGSALCFPIESMVFFTICTLGRLRERMLPITPRNVERMSRGVYVYGDDLIIPAGEVQPIADLLELFGLKVNQSKTFGTGMFRESCGMDVYNGTDVTPVYVRSTPPRNRRSAPELVSFVSLANQLYSRGWWTTAKRVQDLVEDILGPLPLVTETSQALGWITLLGAFTAQRWNKDLHRFEVKGWVPSPMKSPDQLEGWGALLKFFLVRGEQPTFEKHLEHSVRPGSVCIKSRWVPAT